VSKDKLTLPSELWVHLTNALETVDEGNAAEVTEFDEL
jgi:hypothetical protein